MAKKVIALSKIDIIGVIVCSSAFIVTVGLLTGLVARPNNCIKPTSTIQQLTTINQITSTKPLSTSITSTATKAESSTRTATSTATSTTPRLTRTIPAVTTPTRIQTTSRNVVTTRTTTTARTTTTTSKAPTTSTSTTARASRTIPALDTTTSRLTSPVTNPADSIRLPSYISPIHYDLFIKVIYQVTSNEQFNEIERFIGSVKIEFLLTNKTNRIVLHADRNLDIEDNIEIVVKQSGETIRITSLQHSFLENQLYEIKLDKEIKSGEYVLKINYIGNFGPVTNIIGFYKTQYNEDGITKSVLATKFQPTDARKAFPCFDEPALKATFSISIDHPKNSLALSNWNELQSTDLPLNRVLTKFEKTYKMSTYLAAWTVLPNDFGFKEKTTAKGKKIRVYARKEAVKQGLVDFALDVTRDSIDFFEGKYFDPKLQAVPPKIDMIAFPDFPSGAMEHWGLVGFRETNLLFEDSKNSASNKQSVAFVIAHEVAHFWFGNLATCKWWNDLWLNEAMARFLQFKAVDFIFPDWDVINQFLTLYEIPVMFDDGIQSSAPISTDVLTPAQINSAFNSVVYDKGSSLLRMLEDTVGAENFQKGLNLYLEKNQFEAAEGAAFYNSLDLPFDFDVEGITPQAYMENWLLEPNFPRVKAIIETTNSPNKSRVKFTQDRFLLSEFNGTKDYTWYIYLKCQVGGAYVDGKPDALAGSVVDITYLLDKKEGSRILDAKFTWIKCNKNFKGFYTTLYDAKNFIEIENILKKNKTIFTKADRVSILNDAFLSPFANSLSYEITSLTTSYLEQGEIEYVPWRTFTLHMSKLASLMENRPSFSNLRIFSLATVKSYSDKLDIWQTSGDPHVLKLLKANFVEFLGRMQDVITLNKVSDAFDRINKTYFSNPGEVVNNLNPNLRSSVYKYHVQNAYDFFDWYSMFELYMKTFDPQEKSFALNAISQTRQFWIIDTQFSILLEDNSKIKPQDFFTLLNSISRNPSGRNLAWYFIRFYWFEIIAKFGPNSRTLANSVKTICETFENRYLLLEMAEFFSLTDPGAGTLQRQQAYDTVLYNVFWIEKKEQEIINSFFGPAF